jgi:hypothetical protein
MKTIKLNPHGLEVTKGDVIVAYYPSHGYGRAIIKSCEPFIVEWVRNDWRKNLEGMIDSDIGNSDWENWTLDETSVAKRILKSYD